MDYSPDVFIMNNESRVVNFTQPAVTDNSGAPVNVTVNYQSGTQFPFSDTVVIFTAMDTSGNTATCNFTVSVDGEPVFSTMCTNATLCNLNESVLTLFNTMYLVPQILTPPSLFTCLSIAIITTAFLVNLNRFRGASVAKLFFQHRALPQQ